MSPFNCFSKKLNYYYYTAITSVLSFTVAPDKSTESTVPNALIAACKVAATTESVPSVMKVCSVFELPNGPAAKIVAVVAIVSNTAFWAPFGPAEPLIALM